MKKTYKTKKPQRKTDRLVGIERGENTLRQISEPAKNYLQDSTDLYQSFVKNFQGIVFRGTLEFFPFFLHGKLEEITGYTEKIFTSKKLSWDKIIFPDDLKSVYRTARKLFTIPDFKTEIEYRIIRKDGQIRWLREYVQNICNEVKKPEFVQGVIYDITEKRLIEERLRESEERYNRIFEYSKEGIIASDKDGKIILANPTAANILGYNRSEELIGMMGNELYAYPEQRKDLLQKLIKKRVLPNLELKFRKKDGSLVDIKGSTSIHLDKNGNILQIDGIFRDITKEKMYERQIQESEEKLKLIAETICEVFWIADVPTEKIFYISPAYESIWGRSCKSLYENPRSFIDAIHPDDREKAINTMKAKETGHLFKHEYRIIHTDGSIRWIMDRGFPVPDKTGRVTRYVGIAQDITDQKDIESALYLQSEIVANMSEGVLLVNTTNNKIIYANKKMNELFGYSQDELNNKHVSILNAPAEVDPKERSDTIARMLKENGVWFGEVPCKKKDGTLFWCQCSISKFNDTFHGEMWIGIHKDISKRKQAEEASLRSQKELNIKANELEELNAALNILLKKRDEERKEIEEKLLINIKELISPYLEKLIISNLNKEQRLYTRVLQTHLEEILSPFTYRLTTKNRNLTPTEIKIANLVKQGKTSKEIAQLLNSSKRAIEFHRNNLRKKLGLKTRKDNLRSYLLTIQT